MKEEYLASNSSPHMNHFRLFPFLCIGLLFVAGCGDSLQADTTPPDETPRAEPAAPLEFPAIFDPHARFIDLEDFSHAWVRYATPDGRLSFLHPQSWDVGESEWKISRTVYIVMDTGESMPPELILTVHTPEDMSVDDAIQNEYERIRAGAFTDRIIREESDLARNGSTKKTIVAYRTGKDGQRAYLHFFVPRERSYLTLESSGTNETIAYPLRVLLESIKFRD